MVREVSHRLSSHARRPWQAAPIPLRSDAPMSTTTGSRQPEGKPQTGEKLNITKAQDFLF